MIHLPKERGLPLVLGRGGDKVLIGLQIKAFLISEHPVPYIPAAAEGLLKELRLLRCGIEGNFDGVVLDLTNRSVRHLIPLLFSNTKRYLLIQKVYFLKWGEMAENFSKRFLTFQGIGRYWV